MPAAARIAFVSTRRAQPAADSLAGRVTASYILHDMTASISAPMHELSSAHLVVVDVPPVVTSRFEHDLLKYIYKLLALNVLVLAVVQHSLRRQTNKTLWVHEWNLMAHAPFKFYQTRSCKTGDCVQGCHLTY